MGNGDLHHLAGKPSPLVGPSLYHGSKSSRVRPPSAHGGAKPDRWKRERCPARHLCGEENGMANVHGGASRRALLMAATFLFNWQRNRVNQ